MNTILVISPHPDDDILGCGGSICHHIQNGDKVQIVYMTSGESGSAKQSKKELARIRESEAQQAARVLGVSSCTFLRLQDGNIMYTHDTITRIATIIRHIQPTMVYIPHENDAHADHHATHSIEKKVSNAQGWKPIRKFPGRNGVSEPHYHMKYGHP